MFYLGIDPGKDGGITLLSDRDCVENCVFSEDDLLRILELTACDTSQVRCVLEKVGAMPGQGVTSMFNFGQNFGFIQGALKAYCIPFELVPPQKWKKEFGATSDKNTSIDIAKRLFPNLDLRASSRCKNPHDGKAESLLMAEYARRKL